MEAVFISNEIVNTFQIFNSNYFVDSLLNFTLVLEKLTFKSNSANKTGACFFINNQNSHGKIIILENEFYKNKIFLDNNQLTSGSVIHLANPSSIEIKNSIFKNNIAILGTCIYYDETYEDLFVLNLEGNLFESNYAILGGAGLFMETNFYKIKIEENNKFINNYALYGNDYSSPPFRMKYMQKNNKNLFYSQNNQSLIKITVMPGITNIKLYFVIFDYFGQHIKSLNGEFSNINLKNIKDFSNKLDNSINLIGLSSATIINGSKDYFNFVLGGN